jgi:hypothetical protein
MARDSEPAHIVKLAERDMIAALEEWLLEINTVDRPLTFTEENLRKRLLDYIRYSRATKSSGKFRLF